MVFRDREPQLREMKKRKLLLVCSAGGHFLELYLLKELWTKHKRVWATLHGRDTEFLLRNERVYWGHEPTIRNLKNFVRNLFLAAKVLRKEKPDILISTGAAIGVPFIFVGKILGIKTIFIELLTRVTTLSLSGKLVYPVAHYFIVQWPELTKKYKKAVFRGKIYDIRNCGNRGIFF
jgi:UDP-N-acetylglucosamine:LPS N-acetylglucosamine transferase